MMILQGKLRIAVLVAISVIGMPFAIQSGKENNLTLSEVVKSLDDCSMPALDKYRKQSDSVEAAIWPILSTLSTHNEVLFSNPDNVESMLSHWNTMIPWLQGNIKFFKPVLKAIKPYHELYQVEYYSGWGAFYFVNGDSNQTEVQFVHGRLFAKVHDPSPPPQIACGDWCVFSSQNAGNDIVKINKTSDYLCFSLRRDEHILHLVWANESMGVTTTSEQEQAVGMPLAVFDKHEKKIVPTKSYIPCALFTKVHQRDFDSLSEGKDLGRIFGVPQDGQMVEPEQGH